MSKETSEKIRSKMDNIHQFFRLFSEIVNTENERHRMRELVGKLMNPGMKIRAKLIKSSPIHPSHQKQVIQYFYGSEFIGTSICIDGKLIKTHSLQAFINKHNMNSEVNTATEAFIPAY
jgi:hypothetical protein